jgi:hypothetical protein
MRAFIFTVIVLFAGLVFAGVPVQGQSRALLASAQRVSSDRFAYAARTPRGAVVYGVNQPSRAMLDAIDRGLGDLFAVSRRNGYGRGLSYQNYTIFIARADRTQDSSGGYSPDIAVGAAQYAGSVYDQGGYVYAAGMVISFSPGAFVIAEHNRDLNRVSDIVRYEGEHIVLYQNDRRRYAETADHSRGGGHPILQ